MTDKTKSKQKSTQERATVTVTEKGRQIKNSSELLKLMQKRGDLDSRISPRGQAVFFG